MSDQDWADRRIRFHEGLVEALGPPVLVTDPKDGITRPTWTLEMPQDALEELCRAHNARRGWVLVESEGGETD